MDPRDFVRLASTLAVASPIDPARCRTSISRAYYGAFHCASGVLTALDAPIGKGGSDHGHAFRLFQRSGDLELEAAGVLLSGLHRLRILADYRMAPDPKVEAGQNARNAALDALQIVSAVDNVLADPSRRTAARTTIRSHYQGVTGNAPPP